MPYTNGPRRHWETALDLSGEKLFQILINDTNWQYSEVREKYYTVDGRGIYNKDYRFTAKIRF